MSTAINSIRITNGNITQNGARLDLSLQNDQSPEAVYRALHCSYAKFFKMDVLCKWAWLGAEHLLKKEDGSFVYNDIPKEKIAVVLATGNGCIEVDKRYQESMQTIPSPALFVYTLPNIMLGEICIRHGFKGEQLCMVQEEFNPEALLFWANDLLVNRGMEACLFGWVDALNGIEDVCLFWMNRKNKVAFSEESIMQVYQ